MSRRSTRLLIGDILESGNKIILYTNNISFEEFTADEKTIDAVVRNFEIIGEAVSRLPTEFKNNHPEIDWRRIKGFRNRIVHEYFGVDLSIVWQIKEQFLPGMLSGLQSLSDD